MELGVLVFPVLKHGLAFDPVLRHVPAFNPRAKARDVWKDSVTHKYSLGQLPIEQLGQVYL